MLLADFILRVLTILREHIGVQDSQSATDKAARWDLHARRTASLLSLLILPCFLETTGCDGSTSKCHLYFSILVP